MCGVKRNGRPDLERQVFQQAGLIELRCGLVGRLKARLQREDLRRNFVVVDAFNYSLFALETLQGHDLELYRRMMADPAAREVIFATARTPNA